MLKLIFCFFCLWWFGIATIQAQQDVVAAGGDAAGTGGSISYSIGQVFYTVKGSSTTLTDGVQQPYEVYSSIQQLKGLDLTIKTFPNPTQTMLYLNIDELPTDQLQWKLFDAGGKLLQLQTITDNTTAIPVQALAAGRYILQVMNSQSQFQSFTIIKN